MNPSNFNEIVSRTLAEQFFQTAKMLWKQGDYDGAAENVRLSTQALSNEQMLRVCREAQEAVDRG